MDKIRVLFTIAGLHPESGGPSQSVPALAAALAAAGAEPELFSLHYGEGWQPPKSRPENIRTTFVPCTGWLSRMQWTPGFQAALMRRCIEGRPQILHDTGLWLLTNHAAANVAGKVSLPRIVSPRGMLSGWALRHKGWKKKLAWNLYQRRDIATAQVLHATSAAEAEEFRALGLKQSIAVIPNGVELPPPAAPFPQNQGRRTVLYLSRLHPKKGLVEMVRAWAAVKPAGWRAVIAGGDEEGYRVQIEDLVRSLGLEKDIEFAGAVSDESKWGYYRQADVFILPSHSENFGIVVAEALACGLPVIATRGTPWEDLLTHRCGWWCGGSVEQLAATLREATSATDESRRGMGLRGRSLVKDKYAWAGIAARMMEVYRWMLGHQARPDCVMEP
jgi:glycosyltransferase involved in cell wall biosynthesis